MPDSAVIVDVVGWIGVGLYVTAYYLVSIGRLGGRSRLYQQLNLLGAAGVAANAFHYDALPSAIVNVIWFGIAVLTLTGILRGDDGRDPAHPESPEGRAVHRILFFAGALLAVVGLGISVLVIFPRAPRPPTPVRIVTEAWPPYVDPSRPDGGPLVELVREALRSAGHEPRIEFTDWSSALEQVAEGGAAAAFPFIATEGRREDLRLSEPLVRFEYVLFRRRELVGSAGERGDAAVAAWLDARAARNADEASAGGELRLGLVRGYEVWDELAAIAEVAETYETSAAAFRALAAGEIDLLAEGRLAGRYVLADPATGVDAARIEVTELADPRARSTEALRIAVRDDRSGEALLGRFDAAVASLRARGRVEAVRRQLELAGRDHVSTRSVVSARRIDGSGDIRRLPAGTRGIVLAWPASFGDSASADAGAARIKVLDGPLAGWELLVDPEDLELVVDAENAR